MAKVYTLVQFQEGVDIQSGSLNPDNFSGTVETDILSGAAGNDTLRGDDGDDFLLGQTDNDAISGQAGDDFLFVSDDSYAQYILDNFTDPASVISNAADRQFQIDEWFDILNVTQTADPGLDISVAGGAGFDTASIDLSFDTPITGVVLSFAASYDVTLPNGTTSVTDVEAVWVRGTQAADTITGGANGDRIYGEDGKDKLAGGGGDDLLFGGKGADDMRGGGGDDFIVSTDFYSHFESVLTPVVPGDFVPFEYIHGLNAIETKVVTDVPTGQFDTLIDGGDGNDTAVLDFSQVVGGVAFELDPSATVALPNGTQMKNVEAIWVIDSAGFDDITGGALDDQFLAAFGPGNRFDGAGGTDTYVAAAATGVAIDLTNSANNGGGAQGTLLVSIEDVIASDQQDVVVGDENANHFWSRLGDDVLQGGGGNDTLDGGFGADSMNGNAGAHDVASYASSVFSVKVDLLNTGANLNDALGDTYLGIEDLEGTRRGDTLLANDNANTVDGSLGQDTIRGRDGNDRLIGNAGNDSLAGDGGSDTAVFTGNRSDYLITVANNIFTIKDLRGTNFDGTDTVTTVENFEFADQTRSAADLINAPPTDITISNNEIAENSDVGTVVATLTAVDPDTGETFTFSEVGNSAAFSIVGDELRVAGGIDFEAGDTQTITIKVTDSAQHSIQKQFIIGILDVKEPILGDENANLLEGTSDADTIRGLGGNDTIVGSAGGDTMDGGAGRDTVRFDSATTLNLLDPSKSTGDAAGDTYTSVEVFQFSEFADKATGDAKANIFNGGEGADTLGGGGGNDQLRTGEGNDSASGGAGNDLILGGEGRDIMGGGSGKDQVNGQGGNDTLFGGDANDKLIGGDGNDRLTGGDGNDNLSGGGGADTLEGGPGADRFTGGDGVDHFVFGSLGVLGRGAGNRDIITDFKHNTDRIDISDFDARTDQNGTQNFDFIGTDAFDSRGQVRAVQVGANTVLLFNTSGDLTPERDIVLSNVVATTLIDGDFIF